MATDSDLNVEALKEKYAEERQKRLDAGRGHIEVAGPFSRYLNDPLSRESSIARDPMVEESDVLIVGGGISGLCTAAHLCKRGVRKLRIVEAANNFGGTWYWNRYPGAACDIESYIYLPLLDETGYVPKEKYAGAEEIYEYLCLLGRHFALYDRTSFQTRVIELRWDEESDRWITKTDRGDVFKARFICLATGGLSQPKLPAIRGIETFGGHSFHTCRWDYHYTGRDSHGNMPALGDKCVAILGTGATAIQVIPRLAHSAHHLYVFQRTPSAVHGRLNRPTDVQWAKALQPGWQQKRMRNFQEILLGRSSETDLVADGWTDITRGLHVKVTQVPENGKSQDLHELKQLADFKIMEALRRRIDEIVVDPTTAAALKPYYNVFCKRPCFHDEYLSTFNRPNVTLVDTNGHGVAEITKRGLIVNDREYQVDCIIYSTGFEVGAMPYRAGHFSVWGVGGQSLEEKCSRGFKSLHGIFTHGFPNMMIVGGLRGGPASVNGTYVFEGQSHHIARVIKRCLDEEVTRLEATQQSEERWMQAMHEKQPPSLQKFLSECTPGFANGEGTVDAESLVLAVYAGGSIEYFDILDSWLTKDFDKDMSVATAETLEHSR